MAQDDFISGYLTDLEIDSVDHTVFSNNAVLDLTRNTIRKPVFGKQFPVKISGLLDGSLTSAGHISPDAMVALDAAYKKNTPVGFVLKVGETGTDGGNWAGNGILSRLVPIQSDADGQVGFSLDMELTEQPVYTAGTP